MINDRKLKREIVELNRRMIIIEETISARDEPGPAAAQGPAVAQELLPVIGDDEHDDVIPQADHPEPARWFKHVRLVRAIVIGVGMFSMLGLSIFRRPSLRTPTIGRH